VSVAFPLVQIGLLGEAVDGAPVAILVADEHGRYTAANRFACEMLGYTREELLELNVADVAVSSDIAAHYDAFVARGFEEGVIDIRRKDGSTVSMRYRAGETTIAGITYYVSVGAPAD
jgi:PAS domain S-box-containing protein